MLSFIFNSLNQTTTPSVMIRLNLWFFLNVQVFKNKFSSIITYFLENMSSLKFKKIKIYYYVYNFENFYFIFFKLLLILIILVFSLILFF